MPVNLPQKSLCLLCVVGRDILEHSNIGFLVDIAVSVLFLQVEVLRRICCGFWCHDGSSWNKKNQNRRCFLINNLKNPGSPSYLMKWPDLNSAEERMSDKRFSHILQRHDPAMPPHGELGIWGQLPAENLCCFILPWVHFPRFIFMTRIVEALPSKYKISYLRAPENNTEILQITHCSSLLETLVHLLPRFCRPWPCRLMLGSCGHQPACEVDAVFLLGPWPGMLDMKLMHLKLHYSYRNSKNVSPPRNSSILESNSLNII